MKTPLKSTVLSLVAATAVLTSAASASTISGDITSLDKSAHRLVLRHHAYHLPKSMMIGHLHRGQRIQLTYHWSRGRRWVTAYRPIPGKGPSAMHTRIHMPSKT
ncbi:MAG: hypothetical protein R3D57_19185 [Hyphomicrobiaceae bacterium]